MPISNTYDKRESANADALRARLPRPLRDVFDACYDWVVADGRVGLAVHGSLVKGGLDRYSDLDMTLAAAPDLPIAELVDAFDALIAGRGEVLAGFRADHLGFVNTRIAYIAIDEWVVKVDAQLLDSGSSPTLPSEALVLLDPVGALVGAKSEVAATPDIEILFGKLCGWFWFTYSRLARGELFAAARSIDFSREHALLPIVLHRLGLPQDGHRRIEERLPAELLAGLGRTHPRTLEKEVLFDALAALHAMTDAELRLAPFDRRLAALGALESMWAAVLRARAGTGATTAMYATTASPL